MITRGPSSVLLLLGALLLGAEVAGAECLPGGIPGAIAVRIDREALALARPLLVEFLPRQVPVPPEPILVFECSGEFDDTILTPDGLVVALEVQEIRLIPQHGALDLDATLDVRVTGGLGLQLCALPDDHCQLEIEASGVHLLARLAPVVEDCQASARLVSAEVHTDSGATAIRLSACGLGDLWDLVYEWFGEAILAEVEGTIATAVAERVPPLLAGLTTGLLAEGLELYGYRATAAVEEVLVTPDALSCVLAADVRPLGEPPGCLPADAALPAEPEIRAPRPASRAHAGFTISPSLLQRAARAAWLGGHLCFDSQDWDLDLATPLDFLVPEVEVVARLSLPTPPAIQLSGTPEQALATVTAEGVQADVLLQVPGHPETTLTTTVDAQFAGSIEVDPATQAIGVALTGARSTTVDILAPGLGLTVSAGTVQSMLDRVLLPRYAAYVGRVPLVGNVFADSPLPVAARAARVGVADGFLELDWELIAKVPEDLTPPETVVGPLGDDPQPEEVKIPVLSTDDTTPTRFLRHVVSVDGTPELAPLEGSLLQLPDQPHGMHEVTLWALDLQGNRDPTPETVMVLVDVIDPVVTLTDAPPGVTRDSRVTIGVEAHDETSPRGRLRVHYTFGEVQGDNLPDRIIEQGECLALDTLTFAALPEDRLVRLTVEASDIVGNRGSEWVAFARNSDPTLACGIGRGPAHGPGLLLAGLLGALGLLRRRTGGR
ncbi:MAG: hypothetical protein RBU45_05690 [Myxococcota bacterium]|jgi:hypothetical protein|nr:hypothetical protein [Myxococcota bacterium]